VANSTADRLALRLRLGDDWRDMRGPSSGGIVAAHEVLVARGKLKANAQQSAAAAALLHLPTSLAEARLARQQWLDEQARLTADAEALSASGHRARASAAAWQGEGWFKGTPSTPKTPAVVGPMCWLRLGPPPLMQPAGCYIHGSVGSGKSTLMDLFCLFGVNEWRVRRQHFHEFSLWLHESLHSISGSTTKGAPQKHILARVADSVAEGVDVICLDEFAVTNVADAAILAEVLRLLAERHVAVVCTTNRPPEDLYKDGLHRERYLPALVNHLRGRFLVTAVTGVDHREEMLRADASAAAEAAAEESPSKVSETVFFDGMCANTALSSALGPDLETLAPTKMKVSWGRSLPVKSTSGGVACFHFNELCRHALGAEDFLFVATKFHTVFVHDVPRLSLEEHNEARRFTNLVDALYEHSVRMLCHSDVPLSDVLKNIEALRDASDAGGHDADRLGLFQADYDDSPNFQIQIKELGSREKWVELQEKKRLEEQRAHADRLGKLAAPAAVEGTTGSGWSAAPAGSDLSAPDQGVAGVMVAAVGSLQESGFAARRAMSRLKEMQTTPYLEAARRRREEMV